MLERIRRRSRDFASDWAVPICMGLATGVAVWLVWYFTKPQCTVTAAAVCNLGVIAHFINVEILLKSGGAALAVGALKGGYDRYIMRNMLNQERDMLNQEREALNREREARHLAEQQLADERKLVADERKRVADERKRADETIQMVTELVNEFREERRQNAATQQAMLDAVLRLVERNGSNSRNDD